MPFPKRKKNRVPRARRTGHATVLTRRALERQQELGQAVDTRDVPDQLLNNPRASLDIFFARQLERVQAVTSAHLARVENRRAARANTGPAISVLADRNSLVCTVRGAVGSDAHPDTAEP